VRTLPGLEALFTIPTSGLGSVAARARMICTCIPAGSTSAGNIQVESVPASVSPGANSLRWIMTPHLS
jgi:hypothetical protein